MAVRTDEQAPGAGREHERDHEEDERPPAAGLVAARRRIARLLRRGRGRAALGSWIDEHRVSSSLIFMRMRAPEPRSSARVECCEMGIASVDAQAAGDRLSRQAVRGPEKAAAATRRGENWSAAASRMWPGATNVGSAGAADGVAVAASWINPQIAQPGSTGPSDFGRRRIARTRSGMRPRPARGRDRSRARGRTTGRAGPPAQTAPGGTPTRYAFGTSASLRDHLAPSAPCLPSPASQACGPVLLLCNMAGLRAPVNIGHLDRPRMAGLPRGLLSSRSRPGTGPGRASGGDE